MILQIWQSYRRLPLWVQLWVALILVPVNAASLFFLTNPAGAWVALMAVGAMLCTPMLGLILWLLNQDIAESYRSYLIVLLAVDVVSLILDVIDSRKWLSGDRKIA